MEIDLFEFYLLHIVHFFIDNKIGEKVKFIEIANETKNFIKFSICFYSI